MLPPPIFEFRVSFFVASGPYLSVCFSINPLDSDIKKAWSNTKIQLLRKTRSAE